MNQRTFFAAFLATAMSFYGCGGKQSPPVKVAPPPAPLTKAELAADMAKRLNLRDVTLTEQAGGRFTGTARDAEGKVIELEVNQGERRRSWKLKWKGPNGLEERSDSTSW
jgi:YD repeat-containing protein